jgi:16S rRNA (uracil1498-N3)-methyltransferase
VITTAVKQSIKAFHPKLNDPQSFADIILKTKHANKFIAHCVETKKFAIKDQFKPNSDYLIMIGPEGDFTSSEIDLAMSHNFIPISLGDSRLRTETAALEACFEINFLNR